MGVGSAIAIYFIIWWIALFAVLPWGVRSQAEHGDVVPGSEPGAPVHTRVLRIIVINSMLSAVIFAAVYLLWRLEIIGFHG